MFSFILTLRRPPFMFGSSGNEETYKQKIDHFGSNDLGTFNQRYFVNASFYNEKIDPPRLIVYIGGESTLSDRYTKTGSYIDLAEKTESLVVSLEHRYFGKSQPFEELLTENLRYLTSEQALADLAEFIKFIKSRFFPDREPTVLVVGGSYPGTLSSYFRMKYPHLANFSWASSAPLWVKNDFSEYDKHCAEVLMSKSELCYTKTRDLYTYFNNHAEELSQNYINFTKSTDPDAHLSIISDFIAGIVQYDNSFQLVTPYCEEMEKAEGLGKDVFLKYFFKYMQKSGVENPDDFDDFLNNETSSTSDNADSRSWTWMTCNEFGWYQTPSGLLRPARVNLEYSNRVCKAYFNVSLAKHLEEKELIYGGINPKSSMVYFTNGNTDPWSELSVQDNVSDFSVGRYSVHIDGASHCSDLHSYNDEDPEDLKEKREKIMVVMERWLKGETKTGCQNGDYMMGFCVCKPGYFGEMCDMKHISSALFRVFTTLVVVLPTLMMIIIGSSAWHLFKKNNDDTDIRTIPSILN